MTKFLIHVLVPATLAIASLAYGSAHAAVRWEVNGVKGEACVNASAAWALFKAAQSPEGIISAKVTTPSADDPFVKRCLTERAQRAEERKRSAS